MHPVSPHHLAESEQDEFDIDSGVLPWGYHSVDPVDPRPADVVENDLEVELHHRESRDAGERQPAFTCGYCGDRFRSASLRNALRWWSAHDCLDLEDRDRLARLYDIGALPDDHPFAA